MPVYRSDPRRAAELAAYLTAHLACRGLPCHPHHIADTVAAMQKAARAAKTAAENACNYPQTEAQEARAEKRGARAQAHLNESLRLLFGDNLEAPTVTLGGDPRGPCAMLHIPGERGDGWGDGFGIY